MSDHEYVVRLSWLDFPNARPGDTVVPDFESGQRMVVLACLRAAQRAVLEQRSSDARKWVEATQGVMAWRERQTSDPLEWGAAVEGWEHRLTRRPRRGIQGHHLTAVILDEAP